ncbi:MAG: DUF983 domain-containing protein [Saprospiraceae bacterium]|jgi:uncharacterized protein (DUF983 family)|nr:DUF983 domain-containing protein [Saprospiraceae bacterium]
MSKERSLLMNTFMYKCPRCQEGDIYTKPFKITDPVSMPHHCDVCGQLFLPEPGFYYGAMFLSYIVTGFFFLGVVAFSIIVLKLSVNAAMGVVILVAASTYIFFLRFARALWLNLMVRYDKNAKENFKNSTFQ